MSDNRPERVYGILVSGSEVFLPRYQIGERIAYGLPGGIFRPFAEDRKAELKAHLFDQLSIEASAVWAQGAFDYRHPLEDDTHFSGFYSVWEWEGSLPPGSGEWFDTESLARANLPPSLMILLTSVLATLALRTR